LEAGRGRNSEPDYNEVFQRFRHLIAGKTKLLISHRFSTTVRMAGRIIVLDGGITEAGARALPKTFRWQVGRASLEAQ
jgi:ABC-type transport system involved in cytochrome bd biosynthesis fused ATPase/permease subunit